jgi:hypothetical protein
MIASALPPGAISVTNPPVYSGESRKGRQVKDLSKVIFGVCLLAAGFVGLTSAANADEHGTASGQCTMSNVAANKVLYDGDCIINANHKRRPVHAWTGRNNIRGPSRHRRFQMG